MKRGAVAGWRSASGLGIWATPPEIFARAEASAIGLPQISAPSRSASYSLVRLMAIWMIMAARGARIIMARPMIGCGRLSPRPPNRKPNWASVAMAPATVALTVMISVSRLRTWASSWAMTPASSSQVRSRIRPVVAATAAFSGLRPVAKALGCGLSIT
jgi:hypothetical protein